MSEPRLRIGGTGYDELVAAIRAEWTQGSSSAPDRWTPERPSIGQCEVSTYALWEYTGGEIVTARVLIDGVQTEYHSWNRVDGADVDLTADQFDGDEQIMVLRVFADHELRGRPTSDLRPGLGERVDRFGAAVRARRDRRDPVGS